MHTYANTKIWKISPPYYIFPNRPTDNPTVHIYAHNVWYIIFAPHLRVYRIYLIGMARFYSSHISFPRHCETKALNIEWIFIARFYYDYFWNLHTKFLSENSYDMTMIYNSSYIASKLATIFQWPLFPLAKRFSFFHFIRNNFHVSIYRRNQKLYIEMWLQKH